MKTIKYLTNAGETKTAILSHRIDSNLFACKSSARKRRNDVIVHIDNMLSDVSSLTYSEEIAKDQTHGGMSQDEFDGLLQAGSLGLKFPEPTILVNN